MRYALVLFVLAFSGCSYTQYKEPNLANIPTRPVLTFPDVESEWIRAAYAAADVILEYGSGGSTVLGYELKDKVVFSVESDKKWTDNLQSWLDNNPGQSPVHLHYVDIGPTGDWGYPSDKSRSQYYHEYPLSVWEREDFIHPDTVLIDGRFRMACFMTVALNIKKPVDVYYDDYVNRPHYHAVENYVKLLETRGRMAKFRVHPLSLSDINLMEVISFYSITN